jgi:CRP-like cAMP-binding protein
MNQPPDLLAGLSEVDCNKVLELGSPITLPSGAELFALGAQADNLFIVERGRVKLTLPMQVRGKQEDITVEEIKSGQTVGWSALIPPHRFTLKATALMDTELIVLDRKTLQAYFSAQPAVGCVISLNLAVVIGHRLQLFQAMWLREMQRMVENQYA